LIAGIIVIYKINNPPRSGILLLVPVSTLEKFGIDVQNLDSHDLFFRLSRKQSCNSEFSNHNYTVMFNQNVGNWQDVRVWTQHVTLYLTWQESWEIEDKVHLCIRLKGKWESAWEGRYELPIAYKSFFCNKESVSSKWECLGYENYQDKNKKEEIYNLLTKYNVHTIPNKALKSGTPKSGAP